MSPWLTLQEYSYHYGISASTLRRKIKNEEIEYKLKKGRYFLRSDFNETEDEEDKTYYKQELEKKEKELLDLKHNHEDLMNLVQFLEMEKKELLNYIETELAG